MSNREFDLEKYLANSVDEIVAEALAASSDNPEQSAFMEQYAHASRNSSQLRDQKAQSGTHIPPFLVASITDDCNLDCRDCHPRDVESRNSRIPVEQLSDEAWAALFREAASLGIGFIFLVGGEPLLREDVIIKAGEFPEILFPVVTNGTLLDEEYLRIFNQSRNLIPLLSIEGGRGATDRKRGNGVYQTLENDMEDLADHEILFGASVTVTTSNLRTVVSRDFANRLHRKGCRAVLFVEYVATSEGAEHLALGEEERAYLEEHLQDLRNFYEDMIFVSFPGDEKESGGCLAGGRGFFYINPYGGAQPCSFSPYSDINVKDVGIEGALHSELFQSLKDSGLLTEEHEGGCVLYEEDAQVKELMDSLQ